MPERRQHADRLVHRIGNPVDRHAPGAADFTRLLLDRTVLDARRRGKYLWLPLDGHQDAVLAHLGMSGQLLVRAPGDPDETHLRVRLTFDDGGPELRFVDVERVA